MGIEGKLNGDSHEGEYDDDNMYNKSIYQYSSLLIFF